MGSVARTVKNRVLDLGPGAGRPTLAGRGGANALIGDDGGPILTATKGERMSLKDKIEKELAGFKAWAEEANMQAHLAKAEVSAEQNIAKLEAKLEGLGEQADEAADHLVETLKKKRAELKKMFDD